MPDQSDAPDVEARGGRSICVHRLCLKARRAIRNNGLIDASGAVAAAAITHMTMRITEVYARADLTRQEGKCADLG